MLLEPETPLSRSAELDFGFPPHASLVVTYICYPELKLSTGAAGLVSQSLSCKTLLAELGRLGFWWKWSYYLFLLGAARVLSGVSPNGLARSRRNTGPKPETPLR